MFIRYAVFFLVCFILSGCAGISQTPSAITHPYASGRAAANPVQCVPYARQASGIQIRGDAYSWWDQAESLGYSRGFKPSPGAVLVLARTGKMSHGHLAVVKNIVGARQINVTHSNWGSDRGSRRIVYDSMRVEDISVKNDWSRVRFWNYEENVFGFPYAARGFIYQ